MFQEEIIGTAYLAASYLEDSGFDKNKKVSLLCTMYGTI